MRLLSPNVPLGAERSRPGGLRTNWIGWGLAVLLGYAVFQYGGVVRSSWNLCLLGGGLLVVVYAAVGRSDFPNPMDTTGWAAVLLPCYIAFQLVPFPIRLLGWISPARKEMFDALAGILPGVRFGALSAVPAETFQGLLRVTLYTVVFLLIRDLAWAQRRRPWALVVPLVSIGAAEAALGIWQHRFGPVVTGTYVNRNHFAGLLEMVFPFPVMWAVAHWRGRRSRDAGLGPATKASIMMAMAALLLVAILYSLSRMGFVAALVSLLTLALTATSGFSRWRKWVVSSALVLLLLGSFIFVPPNEMVVRFMGVAGTKEPAADVRLGIWQDSFLLIAAFPVFGCGFGAFESAFFRYNRTEPQFTVDYAHNDYLQLWGELGTIGFAIAATLIVSLWRKGLRDSTTGTGSERYRAMACLAAMTAILVHSLTDYNLYIPANGMALAWIAGLAATRLGRGRDNP